MKRSLSFVMKNRAYFAMIMVQFINSGVTLLSKASISKGMNPFVFIVYRQAFALLALSPFAFFERSQNATLSFNLLSKIFLIALLGLTLGMNLLIASVSYVSAAFAAASPNINPALTFILALVLRVESVSVKQAHGIAKILGCISILGGAMIFAFMRGPPLGSMKGLSLNLQIDGDYVKGVILMLSGNTAVSLFLILQGYIVKQYPAKLRLNTLQSLFCGMQTAVLTVILERNNPSAWKLEWDLNLLSVAYAGVIGSGLSFWLQLSALEEKGAVFTAMFSPLCVIVTEIIAAIFWRDEPLYWGSVCGTIMMAIGLYSVLLGKSRESEKRQSDGIGNKERTKRGYQIGVP